MNKFAIATAIAVLAGSSAAFALEPIEGSITFGGHHAQLQKAPVGSSFTHSFTGKFGNNYVETYRVNADHSLSLVTRDLVENN